MQSNSPPDFDPVKGLGISSAIIGEKAFSTLYNYDSELNLVSDQLTTGMPDTENDGKRWIVEIVDGATFHNGDPVTAEDVVYSFTAPREEGSWVASTWSMVDTVEAVDETTVQFDLQFSYGAFGHALAAMQIVPKAVRERDTEKFAVEQPIGSGPFRITKFNEGEITRLERWDDYWGDRTPNLDVVEFVPVKESTTRVTEFKTTEAGLMKDVPTKLYDTVQNISDGTIQSAQALNYGFVSFNLKAGETTKPEVREAIDHCVDLSQVAEKFWKPVGVRQYQPMPTALAKSWDMPLDEFESMAVGKDIDKAKSLFEEANVPDDWTCRMIYEPLEPIKQMMVSIANGIKEAGYDAEVVTLDRGTFLERFTTGDPNDYNIYSLDWGLSPNPDYQIYNMYHESGAGANQGHYWSDDEAMEMIEQARRSTDRDERRQLYADIQRMVIEQRVQMPAYSMKSVWGVKDFVKDFAVSPLTDKNPRLLTESNNVYVETDG
ncbi:ABC transporter substrate-binding protein [Halogeometricum sp. CBA1124]|uniref:ABC transporter substrate-binding protein n=1 Tax=Halogeometricum sp. CBA1124 TaxID=2668071 RepID=UPI0018D2330D|nr:ABC transporter substrate-binding protein [Halogeometricum sp. CBA1124]